MKTILALVALSLLGLAAPALRATGGSSEATSLGAALADGEAAVTLRYRLESVSDDAVGERDATASTLRATLAYRTLPFNGWSFYAEAENVAALGNEAGYDNAGAGGLSNGVTDRPVIADPELTEINQAYARWTGGGTELTFGRQELVIGDSRFVGNVGWRQNHQSFDALRLTNESLARAKLSYTYVDRVHRIVGNREDLSAHLLGAALDAGPAGTLTAYAYLLDYEKPASAALSSATYGIELAGDRPFEGWKLLYELDLARQRDHADNPTRIDAGYRHLLVGATRGRLTAKLGLEVLEGGAADGRFSTPLATLHKFNGWADKFLRTPDDGLEDLYLSLGGEAGPVTWIAVYHDFAAESAAIDYGRELDVHVTYKSPWDQFFGLKLAFYEAGAHAADTDKAMLWTRYGF